MILDPVAGTALCGACGALYVRPEVAEQCCSEPPDPPTTRAVVAGALVLLAVIYLLVFLPYL